MTTFKLSNELLRGNLEYLKSANYQSEEFKWQNISREKFTDIIRDTITLTAKHMHKNLYNTASVSSTLTLESSPYHYYDESIGIWFENETLFDFLHQELDATVKKDPYAQNIANNKEILPDDYTEKIINITTKNFVDKCIKELA